MGSQCVIGLLSETKEIRSQKPYILSLSDFKRIEGFAVDS